MIKKEPLIPQRLRTIQGSFSYIEHRFLRDGFFTSLSHHGLMLYLLLVLVSDRDVLSFYIYDKLCSLLQISLDDYLEARNQLIDKDLIAFDGRFFQVLSLPDRPYERPPSILRTQPDMEGKDTATVDQICRRAFGIETRMNKRKKGQT
ncbi:MAG: hypothetical protein WAN11_09400 [Syntrophobacteraceae bacterium]